MTIDDLTIEVFEGQEYFSPKFIGEGCNAKVYAISDEFVIKIPRVSPSYVIPKVDDFFLGPIVEELEAEFEIQRQLYEGDISVPKPEGIFACTFPIFGFIPSRRRRVGLVMERLYGVNGGVNSSLTIVERVSIYKRMGAELEKAMALGFEYGDACLHNCMYSKELDKLWLIDFSHWELPKTNEARYNAI